MPHLTHTMHTHMQGSALQTVKKFQKILLFLPIPAYLKLGGTRGKFLKTQSDLEKRAFYNPFFFPHIFCCRHPSLSCPSTFLLPQCATWQTGEHELHSSILTLSSNIRATHLKRGTRLCYKLIPSSFSPLSQMLRAKQSRLPSQRYPGKSSASLWSHFFPVISHVFHLSLGIKSCLGSARSLPPLCARGGRRAGFGNRPSHPLLPGFAPASSQYQSHHQLDHSVQFVPSRLRSAPRLETRISWFLCKEKVTPAIILTVLFVKDIAWKAVFQCTSKPEKPMSVCGVYVKVLDRTILLLMSSWK